MMRTFLFVCAALASVGQVSSFGTGTYAEMPYGGCETGFGYITSAATCKSAAENLNIECNSNGSPCTAHTLPSNAANRDSVPNGCYWYPSNEGDYRLFFNKVGYTDAKRSDTMHKSICTTGFGGARGVDVTSTQRVVE